MSFVRFLGLVGAIIISGICFAPAVPAQDGEEIYVPGPVVALHRKLGDDCTFAPDLDIGHCCRIHDEDYQAGGTELDRYLADVRFRDCIKDAGRPFVARVYYWGVRLFGWFFFNYT